MQCPPTRLHIAWIAGLAACAILAAPAAPARALSVTPATAFFDLPVGVDVGSVKGSVDFVGMVTGVPSGGVVVSGSTAATDVTFVFTITLDSDSLALILTQVGRETSGSASPVFSAIGEIPGAGSDISPIAFGADGGEWMWDQGLGQGQTTDPFFLSFSSIAVGDQFRMRMTQGADLAIFTVVPEPGMLGLFAVSLVALAWQGRLRR